MSRWIPEPAAHRVAAGLCLLLAVLALRLPANDAAPVEPQHWTAIAASEVLGPPAGNPPFVFRVSSLHNLAVHTSPGGSVVRFDIDPAAHDSGAESPGGGGTDDATLTSAEFKQVLARVQSVAPFGAQTSQGRLGAVTNLQLRLVDVYQAAVVERGIPLSETSGHDADPDWSNCRVSWAAVFPVRSVYGIVSEIAAYQFDLDGHLFRVRLDGLWYWYWAESKEQVSRLMGRPAFLHAAGPIGDDP